MIKVFIVLILLILSFVGGIFYERLDQSQISVLKTKIVEIESDSKYLSRRNLELTDTLGLVKRQIQTDRIAYENLQKSILSSEQERGLLKQQLEDQRGLLKQLRNKLDQSRE